MKNTLIKIIENLIAGNSEWFEGHDITISDKPDCWMLNYNQIRPPTALNVITRGLVIGKPKGKIEDILSLVWSFPFTRFFNKNESLAADVDIANAVILEKLDGALLGVFSQNKKIHWHTKRMISSSERDIETIITSFNGKKYKLLKLMRDYVNKIPFTAEDADWTYIFEFVHDATQVVTKYKEKQYGLYLIGARNLKTFQEMNEEELDEKAKVLDIPRPQRWDTLSNEKEILSLMEFLSKEIENFEGFVCRDKTTGKRIKLKSAAYVKIHHMINNLSYRNLLSKVLEGETDEILSYFPSAEKRIDKINETMDLFVEHCSEKVLIWQAKKLDRKTLALRIFGQEGNEKEPHSFIRNMVFKAIDETSQKNIKKIIRQELELIVFGYNKRNGSPRKCLEVIGLIDDEEIVN